MVGQDRLELGNVLEQAIHSAFRKFRERFVRGREDSERAGASKGSAKSRRVDRCHEGLEGASTFLLNEIRTNT